MTAAGEGREIEMTTILGTCDYCGRETRVAGLDYDPTSGVYGSFACDACEKKTQPAPAPAVDWRAVAEQFYDVLMQYESRMTDKQIERAMAAYERALAAEVGREEQSK